MKKITPQNLSKRLAKYGTLSLAIAGLADANGQIIYTDVDPDSDGTTNLNNVPINIDLDNDTFPEFDIRLQLTVNLYANPLQAGASIFGNPNGGSVGNYNYPFALNSGYIIGPYAYTSDRAWISNTGQTMVYNNCLSEGSDYNQWCTVTDKYLGLRFDIGGNTHYGWARLDVGELPDSWILKDYAYEQTSDTPIAAGAGSLSVGDNVFDDVRIVALKKSIALFGLPQQTHYRVFSMTGQSVLNGEIGRNSQVIEANTLASGIYVIELKDTTTRAVLRKKIVL